MDKNKIIYILAIMLFSKLDAYSQKNIPMNYKFENKSKILEWGKEEFGYCGDTINYIVNERDIFILIGDNLSGVERKTIFVFLRSSFGYWELFFVNHTNTNKVEVELNQNRKEIIFKSKLSETLLILPFEALQLEWNK